ncbi:MAG: hypothetical protein JSS02_15285, partial [Planctomycetes bacterium]|nr:hypothetical protein [Planctomycetota bacterium]
MRRRHRPTTNSSMSLFPFLDTLVCTMGALILMLLAMTPKIKERALARMAAVQETADESAAAPAPVPSGPSAEEIEAERERRRNGWLAEAEAARTALEQRQSHYRVTHQQLAEAEKRLRELQDQILKARLKSENTEQVEETLEERAEKLEAQAALIAQKIAATRKNLDVANRRQANAPNEYALVAYDGVSGTTRRPIYIECTGQGFRFLPEGEMISASDIEGFTDNFNPLLTGARTLIQFWARRRRAAGPSEPEPYVLLLVRPSGCLSYYVARKSLSSLGAHWGYELIEEDWKLSVPDPDPLAKDLLKDTLAATMQARRPQRREIVLSGDRGRSTFDPAELFESDANSLSGDRGEFGGGRPARAGGRRPSIQQGYATRNDRAPRELPPTEKAAGTIDVNDSRAATGSGQGDGWADARAAGRGEKAGTGVGPGSAVAANMSGKNRGATNASGPRGAPAWGAAGEAGGLSSDRSSAAGDDITGAAIQAPPELAENTIAGATGAAGNSGPGGPSPRGKFSASGGNRAPRARPATLGGIATAEDGSGDQAGDADTGSAGNFEGGTAASDGSLVPLSGSQTGGDPDFPGENAGVAGSRTRGQVGGKQTDPAAGDPSASTTASSAAQAGNPDGNPQLSSPS